MFNIFFFENGAVFNMKWENFAEPEKAQMTIWRMRITCWVTKATNTHPKYVIIIAFSPQQGLYDSASILRYT
jgi:hypothetical protein